MIGRITKSSYTTDGGDLILHLYGRDENHEKFHLRVCDVQSEFFVPKGKEKKFENRHTVQKIKKGGKTIKDVPLCKIVTDKPQDVPKLRYLVDEHYQADVPFHNKVRYDYNWKQYIEYSPNQVIFTPDDIKPVNDYEGHIQPRICYADIEVDDENDDKALDADNATEEIKCISLFDSYIKKYCVIFNGEYVGDGYKEIVNKKLKEANVDITWDGKVVTVPNEISLFRKIKDWIKNTIPDILCGWNFIRYDIKYLKNRMIKLNISDKWLNSVISFDLQDANENYSYGNLRNKLNIQAKEILGVGKLKTPKIHVMYEHDRDKLIAYNFIDTILVREIDKKKGLIDHFLNMSRLCGIDISDTIYESNKVESYVFHWLHGTGYKLPSRDMIKLDQNKIKGGHVGNAKTGVFVNVAVADFMSEYPSIMMECNISPDVLVENPDPDKDYYISPNGNHYSKEKRGIVPQILEELLEERGKEKEKMKKAKLEGNMDEYNRSNNRQRCLKELMNSFYGLFASKRKKFRLLDKRCSEDVTKIARDHVKFTADEFKNIGYNVLYSDTDSVFFELMSNGYEEKIQELENICTKLNDLYDEFCEKYNAQPHEYLRIEPDKMYKKWIQSGAKKRYAGLYEWKDIDMRDRDYKERLEVKGFEIVRSNTAQITVDVQSKIIKLILTDREDEIRPYLKDLKNKVFNGEMDNELGTEGEVKKPIQEYKKIDPRIEAYQWAQSESDFELGLRDPYLWYYTHDKTPKCVPVFHDEEIPFNIDYERMWERNVVNKIKPFMECIVTGNFNMNRYLEGKEVAGLSNF